MSEISGRYKQIMEDIENNIDDPQKLEFVKEKFSELSMMFIDIIDRLTNLTDLKIKEIESKQNEIVTRINNVQTVVDGIENDIYEDEGNYEFEIVCPYCNYEFTADIEDEEKEEIQCPECHNTIELDWNQEDKMEECSHSCSECGTHCMVSEDEEEYNIEDNDQKANTNKNKKDNKDDQKEDEDM